jgi:hypothetical protein
LANKFKVPLIDAAGELFGKAGKVRSIATEEIGEVVREVKAIDLCWRRGVSG